MTAIMGRWQFTFLLSMAIRFPVSSKMHRILLPWSYTFSRPAVLYAHLSSETLWTKYPRAVGWLMETSVLHVAVSIPHMTVRCEESNCSCWKDSMCLTKPKFDSRKSPTDACWNYSAVAEIWEFESAVYPSSSRQHVVSASMFQNYSDHCSLDPPAHCASTFSFPMVRLVVFWTLYLSGFLCRFLFCLIFILLSVILCGMMCSSVSNTVHVSTSHSTAHWGFFCPSMARTPTFFRTMSVFLHLWQFPWNASISIGVGALMAFLACSIDSICRTKFV